MLTMMTEDEREKLTGRLAALDKSTETIYAARKPFDDAISAIDEVREDLLERHDADIAGNCEFCSQVLFVGDLGHRTEEGVLCEECAPTWGDIKEQYEDPKIVDHVAPEDIEAGQQAVRGHMASGGSLDDKHVWEL